MAMFQGDINGVSISQINKERQRQRRKVVTLIYLAAFVIVSCITGVVLLAGFAGSKSSTLPVVMVERDGSTTALSKPAKNSTPTIFVAHADVIAGMRLLPSMFREEPLPEGTSPANFVNDERLLLGYFARHTIPGGTPLRLDMLADQPVVNPITAQIPVGYRAVTINTNITSSVEGWAQAGARVDVLYRSQIRNEQGVTVIVENAKVISAERRIAEESNVAGVPVPSTVTLLVTEDESLRVHLGANSGMLHLVLRGDDDVKSNPGRSLTAQDLLLGSGQMQQQKQDKIQVRIKDKNGAYADYQLSDGELVAATNS